MVRLSSRSLIAPIALVASWSALAGCGGGAPSASVASGQRAAGGQPTSPSASVSPARFDAEAETICRRLETELAAAAPKGAAPAKIARVAALSAAAEARAAGQLERLPTPSLTTYIWSLVVKYRRTLSEELRALADAAGRGDRSAMRSLAAAKAHAHYVLHAEASSAGVATCGELDAGETWK